MKHLRVLYPLAVLAAAGGLARFSTKIGEASEGEGKTRSPAEIRRFREDYIASFPRIPLNTTRGDARFLRIMIQCTRARRGIEVGTATGYGAIHMGMGFEHTGGHLWTIDIDPRMCRKAREHIANMRLEGSVTVVEGDALKEIPKLEGEFDFIFIDAVKRDYFRYFRAVEPHLKPGAVIVADNVIKFARPMRDFLQFMERSPDYDMQIIRCSDEKGDGMAVICKIK